MRISLRGMGLFLVSFITGTLYALVVGLFSGPLRAPLYSWPVGPDLTKQTMQPAGVSTVSQR